MKGMSEIRDLMRAPGMDSRRWSVKGIVTAVTVSQSGIYVDASVGASQDEDGNPTGGWPCRAKYVYQVYVPIRVRDQVTLVFPFGDPNIAAICLGPEVNEDDVVPEDILDDPDSVWLRPRGDVSVRIKCEGDGTRVAIDAPTIELGPDGCTDPVAMWSELKSILNLMKSMLDSQVAHPTWVAGSHPVTIAPTGKAYLETIKNKLDGDTPASQYAKSKV